MLGFGSNVHVKDTKLSKDGSWVSLQITLLCRWVWKPMMMRFKYQLECLTECRIHSLRYFYSLDQERAVSTGRCQFAQYDYLSMCGGISVQNTHRVVKSTREKLRFLTLLSSIATHQIHTRFFSERKKKALEIRERSGCVWKKHSTNSIHISILFSKREKKNLIPSVGTFSHPDILITQTNFSQYYLRIQ